MTLVIDGRVPLIEQFRQPRIRGRKRPMATRHAVPGRFEVLDVSGTLSEDPVYEARERKCDLGYFREIYVKSNGNLGYRCAGEPIEAYVAKGGSADEAKGRKCICNALIATIELGQVRKGGRAEPAIVTAGNSVRDLARILRPGAESYNVADVLMYLLSKQAVVA